MTSHGRPDWPDPVLCSHNVHNNAVLGWVFFSLTAVGTQIRLFVFYPLLRHICVFVAFGGKEVGGSSTWSGASDEAQEPESRRSGGR